MLTPITHECYELAWYPRRKYTYKIYFLIINWTRTVERKVALLNWRIFFLLTVFLPFCKTKSVVLRKQYIYIYIYSDVTNRAPIRMRSMKETIFSVLASSFYSAKPVIRPSTRNLLNIVLDLFSHNDCVAVRGRVKASCTAIQYHQCFSDFFFKHVACLNCVYQSE